MATTKIEDVIVPSVFSDYMIQQTTKKNAFIASGIATADAGLGEHLKRGGRGVDLPFWKRSNANAEVLEESVAMTTHKIQAGGDYAAIHARGLSYSSTDLARLFAGDDPMKAIADMVEDDWQTSFQSILISSLEGVFAVSEMSDHINDISGQTGDAGILSNDALIDAICLLGDNFKALTGIAMHSAVMGKLAKLKLLDEYPRTLESAPETQTYLGRKIIVDDALQPTTLTGGAKAYPIYLFGQGAVAFNENQELLETEVDRDKSTGEDYLFSRRVFTMHPRGIKWKGNFTGKTPSNEALATASNWELVEDSKNVHITKLIARVA